MLPLNPYMHPLRRLYPYKYWYKYWEILPVVGVSAFAFGLTAAHIILSLAIYKDFRFNRSKPWIWEQMDLMHPYPLKYITINQQYLPAPELHHTYQLMKEEETRLKKESAKLRYD